MNYISKIAWHSSSSNPNRIEHNAAAGQLSRLTERIDRLKPSNEVLAENNSHYCHAINQSRPDQAKTKTYAWTRGKTTANAMSRSVVKFLSQKPSRIRSSRKLVNSAFGLREEKVSADSVRCPSIQCLRRISRNKKIVDK